ncbi:cytochrome P450 [Dendryphion nanum]|uniref:Cytochrome P450 n=1 Tax=Dendryphion nanum TaxID=256645 RepID=A0A9P9D909_9PLEO|nr:cytochrome P450 [Dendryphion nanum]
METIRTWELSQFSKLSFLLILGAFLVLAWRLPLTTIAGHQSQEQTGDVKSRDDIPLLGASVGKVFAGLRARVRYVTKGYEMIYRAYEKNKSTLLQVPLVDSNLVIIPPEYVERLKSQPESLLSSSHAVADYFLGSYTTLDLSVYGEVVWIVARRHLTQRLGTLIAPLNEETVFAFQQEIPECREWTPVPVQPALLQIVGRVTSRVFVGRKLARDKIWLQTSIGYATCVFLASGILKMFPSFLRPLAALLVPQWWRIKVHRHNARKLLLPEVHQRKQNQSLQGISDKPDMLGWLIEASSGRDADPENIVKRQLGFSFAAIHTTTNHLTNVIFDLAARWEEYAPALIAEIKNALKEHEGVLSKQMVTKLSKLDSFMKESQRLNPPSALSFNRQFLTSYTLPSGHVLPAHTCIAVASGPIAQSSEHYDSPTEFDGFRFDRMRSQNSAGAPSSANYFTSTGGGSLIFGHGKFACPGRFFAGLESKLILVHLLLNFELRLEVRPENLKFADANFPDPAKTVLWRKL